MKKQVKAMPHIKTKDESSADLYFEFLDPKDRKDFFEDLTGRDEPDISLADFGTIGDKDIVNKEIKRINIKDLTKNTEEFIKRFVRDTRKPKYDFLDYDENSHKYVLKPKYDIEKMIKDITNLN
ncbi:MAG: hypothetical protein PHF86_07345 [Candidatus Nanoarchaeia archaeon]|nr:hypothetical protein [Candidatus Nanoarchaeia archaeon]